MSNVRITGYLTQRAEARTSPDGMAWLELDLHGPDGMHGIEVRRHYGKGPAAQIAAANAAHHLRSGVRVTVHADGLQVVLGAHPHVRLLGVDQIEHQPVAGRGERRELAA